MVKRDRFIYDLALSNILNPLSGLVLAVLKQ